MVVMPYSDVLQLSQILKYTAPFKTRSFYVYVAWFKTIAKRLRAGESS